VNYTELQQLYSKYHDKGLEILAFPCNQFGSQEPGNSEQIKKFAQEKYGVTFTLFQKIDVNGQNEHPLYTYLKSSTKSLLGQSIKWNFTKFLIDRNGTPVKRFGSGDNPSSFESDIKALLE